MKKPRGNTKKIIQKVGEIQNIVGKAQSYIDSSEQYKIRAELDKALKLCMEIRDIYDLI